VVIFYVASPAGRSRAGPDQLLRALLEESPGSLDKLPGNTWARGASYATESATENTPPMARSWSTGSGKVEKVR
jgi:hypothetical protein